MTSRPHAGAVADRGLTFGYLVCQQTADAAHRAALVDEILQEASTAESAGFSSVFVSEHHQRVDNFFPSPLVLAALLARSTTDIDVGIGIAVLPLYHPLRLVEDATCIDIVAGGRFILGLGPGYVPDDLRLYGMDKVEALERYVEGLEIVTHGWHTDWSYEGRWYRAQIRMVTPRPISTPRPRLWIAANTKIGVERAAKMADAWIIGARASLESAAIPAAHYRRACAEANRVPQVAVIRDAWVADSDVAAFEAIAPFLLTTHLERVRGGFIRDPNAHNVDAATATAEEFYGIAADRWLVGSPERIRAQIERWRTEIGASHFILRFRHPTGPSHRSVIEQIQRFGSAVRAARFG